MRPVCLGLIVFAVTAAGCTDPVFEPIAGNGDMGAAPDTGDPDMAGAPDAGVDPGDAAVDVDSGPPGMDGGVAGPGFAEGFCEEQCDRFDECSIASGPSCVEACQFSFSLQSLMTPNCEEAYDEAEDCIEEAECAALSDGSACINEIVDVNLQCSLLATLVGNDSVEFTGITTPIGGFATAPAGTDLTIETFNLGFGPCDTLLVDTTLSVFDGDGNLIAENDDKDINADLCSLVTFQVPADGFLSFAVRSFNAPDGIEVDFDLRLSAGP
ncbi:MAG: PPC domain-containing protein [Myxococcota bacterium]